MNEHVELPATDDVEGHFQPVDGEGRTELPPTRRLPVGDDDDVDGHVLDLDIERRR